MEKFEAARILKALKKNTQEDLEKNFEILDKVLHDGDKKLAKKCMDDILTAMDMAIEALEND